jgi:protocatechuate 3,4-dioxygenase beta subunit
LGTVFDGKCRPLSGAALNAWQATVDGVYGPGQDEGHYQSDPAHIHIAVTHPGAGQLLTEVHFDGEPLSQAGDQFTVVALTRAADGTMQATFDIVLAGP